MMISALTLALVIVLSVFGWSFAQAPNDADPFCTETLPGVGVNILGYAPEVKPLMDSRHYQNLLPPHADAVWQEVDNDENNPSDFTTEWTQNTNLVCRQVVHVCGFSGGNQDNWMITQHISRVVGGTALPQVTVQVDFQLNSCTDMNNCGRTFAIHKYETSTINATAARNLSNYEFVSPRIAPNDGSGDVRENSSIEIDFSTEATGFYLGIRDESTCISVHRVLVFYYVCPAETSDLINRTETVAPRIGNSAPVLVDGECVENSSPENGVRARLTCSQNGVWGGIDGAGCVCDTGFQRSLDGRSCVGCDAGMYLSINVTCLPCPANSNSTQRGLPECPCFEGYFRAVEEPPEMECTQPPSAPLNLTVLQVTNTTVQLSWDPPVSNGGRDDLEYQLSYRRAGVSDNMTVLVYGQVNVTVGQITGLRPFVRYVVMVSGENGVSAQVTNTSGRTASTTITTEEGVPPTITVTPETVQVNEASDIITWQPPAEPNGQILHYNIRIYSVDGNGNEVLVDTVREVQGTTFDFSTRGLSRGTYNVQIQAVTRVGVGEFSESIPLTIEAGSTFPTTVTIVVSVIIVIVAIVLIVLIVVMGFCLWYRRQRVAVKTFYQHPEQIALPTAGHRMYVDPTTYASTQEAVQEYAKEIPPKSLRLQEEIGAGEFGTVYQGSWREKGKQIPIAVKTLRSGASSRMREDFLQEAAIMGQFRHDHVVKLYGVVTVVEPLMIVMEFMDNGSLYTYLRRNDDRLDTYRLVRMARGVASGMNYLSIVGYVHRDLAARNVLVSHDEICKVADFGLSRETINNEYDVKKGGKIPVRWTAPEAIAYRKFTSSSDVWSFGVLLWEVMSYAQHPYEDWDNQTVLDKLEAGHRLQIPKDCPESVYRVMQDCWNGDHTRRPSFEQVVRMLDILLESNITEGPKPKPRQKRNATVSHIQARNPLDFQSVDEWLRAIKMERYIPIFQKNGINSTHLCMQLTKVDLEEMGISLAGHLHKLTQSIENAHAELDRQPSVRI